jgi:hypothetical protein
MTQHEKKALLRLIRQWRCSVAHGRILSKDCEKNGWDIAQVAADTLCDITSRHARQIAHILRRAR